MSEGLDDVVAASTSLSHVDGVLGWSAHCLEQLRNGRLIRPQSAYIGPTGLQYNRGSTSAAV